jgi:transposase
LKKFPNPAPLLFQLIMSPPHTPSRPIRCEVDTTKRARFYHALQNKKKDQSFAEICHQKGIDIPPSTGRLWRRQFEEQGEQALRRTRRQSARLGRPSHVPEAELEQIFNPDHPLYTASIKTISKEAINLGPRQLHKRYHALNARRFKRATSSKISKKNKADRIQYGKSNGRSTGKTITSFWQFVYFTDEVHFNSKDLANKQGYELRRFGYPEDRLPPQEIDQSELNVTLHVAGGISYNHKGILEFYNNPDNPGIPKPRRPYKPRQQKEESDKSYNIRLQD